MVSINSHFTTLETLLQRECLPDPNGQYNYNEVFGCRFLQWNRKYLSYNQAQGWSIVQLNFIDRIIRYLFGSHPATHLTFIANHITNLRMRITSENQMEAQFLDRMQRCWTRANPTANPTHNPFTYHILPFPPPLPLRREPFREGLSLDSSESGISEEDNFSDVSNQETQENEEEFTPEKEIRQLIMFGLTDRDIHEFMQRSPHTQDEIQRLIDQNRSLAPSSDLELYDLIDSLVLDGVKDEEILAIMQESTRSKSDILNHIERAKNARTNEPPPEEEAPSIPLIPLAGEDAVAILPSRAQVNEPELTMATENEMLSIIVECLRSEVNDEEIQYCLISSGYSEMTIQRLIARAKDQVQSSPIFPSNL